MSVSAFRDLWELSKHHERPQITKCTSKFMQHKHTNASLLLATSSFCKREPMLQNLQGSVFILEQDSVKAQ